MIIRSNASSGSTRIYTQFTDPLLDACSFSTESVGFDDVDGILGGLAGDVDAGDGFFLTFPLGMAGNEPLPVEGTVINSSEDALLTGAAARLLVSSSSLRRTVFTSTLDAKYGSLKSAADKKDYDCCCWWWW